MGTHIFRIGCSGYFLGLKFERKLFFLGEQIIKLLFWVHEMPNYFLGLECEKSLRNRENMVYTQA